MKIACLQTKPKETIKKAIDEAMGLANLAIKENVEFIFLPEYCGGIVSNKKLYTPPSELENKHLFLKEFKNFCKKNSVWALIGSIAVKLKNKKIVNRSYIINRNGKIISKYDKIHMFDIFLNGEEHYESKTIDFGDKAVLVNTGFCKIGHSICYDIRFPNLYRKLAQAGAEIIVVPAAFTKVTGSAHWHVLNRARAIETTSYVVSPCAMGKIEGGGSSYGHSLIIDPWGKVLADAGSGRGYITGIIDISLVDEVRSKITSLFSDNTFDILPVSVNESLAL